MSYGKLEVNISGQVVTVPDYASLPPVDQVPIGSARVTLDSGTLYINSGLAWTASGGGGGGVATAANVGGGAGIFKGLAGAGTIIDLKTLTSTDNSIVLTAGASTVDLSVVPPTIAQISAAVAAPGNCFIFTDAGAQLAGYGEWGIDPTTKFANVQLFYQPNNLAANPQAFNINVNIDPLQNSPNDSVQILNISANLDSAATGFDFGTAGDAGSLIVGGFQYGGNGATYGRLRTISLYSGLGNGTDPFTFKGFTAANIGLTTNANVTIDGGCSGYDINLNINAASLSTPNFSVTAFSDFSQIPIDLYGYQGVVIQPNIAKIKDTKNFFGLNISPTIVDFEGNSGFYGFIVGGTITNQGTNGYNGGQINTTITHLTQNSTALFVGGQTTDGTANWQGINLTTNQINTTGDVKALNISTQLGHIAIESQGHHNLQSDLRLASGMGQQYGNVIGGSITIPNGTAITGTDTLANNMAFNVDTGDAGSSWTTASVVGLTTLGFVGQIVGAGQVNGAINFCLGGYSDGHTGHIDRVNNFYAAAIPTGAGGTMDEAVLFLGEMPFGYVATDNWGLRVESSLENYVDKLAIGTTNKKVSNASVALEIGGTTTAALFSNLTTVEKLALTALPGMQVFDTTLTQMSYYNGTVWVNF